MKRSVWYGRTLEAASREMGSPPREALQSTSIVTIPLWPRKRHPRVGRVKGRRATLEGCIVPPEKGNGGSLYRYR